MVNASCYLTLPLVVGRLIYAGRHRNEPWHNRSGTETTRGAIFYVSDPGAPFLDIAQR